MTSQQRLSLRETLAGLNNLSSSVNFNDSDNDDADLFTTAKLVSTGDAADDFNDDLFAPKFASLRAKVSIEETDPKYFGKRTSRIDLEANKMENGETDDEITSNVSEEVDTEDANDVSDASDGDSYADDIENGSSSGIDDTNKTVDHDGADLSIDKQQAVDDADGVDNFFPNKVEEDVKKGKATQMQLDLLDKLLEARIRLQKSVQLTNQLPSFDSMDAFRSRDSIQAKDTYKNAKSSLKAFLRKLLELQEVLFEQNADTASLLTSGSVTKKDVDDEEITSEEEGADGGDEKMLENNASLDLPSKRKHALTVTDFEEEISKRHCAVKSYHEATIMKWYEKTRLSSGKISSKNFGAFDKSTVQQINQVLLDKDRLIKRTQLRRQPYQILGSQNDHNEYPLVDAHLKEYNEQIFDDGDFYHEMLKELIERKTQADSDDPIAAGRRWLELQKTRSKIKRKIDTRASKGRKVRYDVHAKLVNFMTPQPDGTMTDQARNDLFSSLFGKTMHEIDR